MNSEQLSNLNSVLKYSTDDVDNLLQQLASPTHNETRWATENSDRTFRGVLADALDERNRGQEAELLRQPDQHVLVQDGRVRPAKFTAAHIDSGVRALGGVPQSPCSKRLSQLVECKRTGAS